MENKNNWFVRILIIVLAIFIATIITVAFFRGTPSLIITQEIIFLILILVVLSLAETFDSFSISNIISLKKENAKTSEELKSQKEENRELRTQLLNVVSATISNKNINVFGLDTKGLREILVEEAQPNDIEEKRESEEQIIENASKETEVIPPRSRTNLLRAIEHFALDKFIKQNDIPSTSIHKEIKFSDEFIDVDPIMNRNIVFDAYYKTINEEFFIEVTMPSSVYHQIYTLYHTLSKIYYYTTAKQHRSKLIVIIPILPESTRRQLQYHGANQAIIEHLEKAFNPAINKGLLEFLKLEISEEEAQKLFEVDKE